MEAKLIVKYFTISLASISFKLFKYKNISANDTFFVQLYP